MKRYGGRKTDRIMRRLREEADDLSDEELDELGDVAEALVEHPDRRRLLAYLLRHDFGPPVEMDELEVRETRDPRTWQR